MLHHKLRTHTLNFESLEDRSLLTASMGWDGPGAGDATLQYSIRSVPSNMDQALVESVIQQALKTWSDVADITFVRTSVPDQADAIDFSFRALDGPGGVLAQAYFPDDVNRNPIAGDVQFDRAETWEAGNARGSAAFDLMLVAVHEIGHALGLDHDSAAGSVMAASASPWDTFRSLAPDDVDQILQLYAAAPPTSQVASPALPQAPVLTPSPAASPTNSAPDIPTADPYAQTPRTPPLAPAQPRTPTWTTTFHWRRTSRWNDAGTTTITVVNPWSGNVSRWRFFVWA